MSRQPSRNLGVRGRLGGAWDYPSFREAIDQLVALDPRRLARLTELTESGFDLPGAAGAELDLDEDDFVRLLGALRLLYDLAAASAGPEPVLDELEARLAAYGTKEAPALSEPEARIALAGLLMPRPAADRAQAARNLIQMGGPTLEGQSVMLNLRLAEGGVKDPWESLLPLVLVRLFFDEAVGGNPSLAFQVTPEALDALIADLADAKRRLETIPADLRERTL